uniref:Tumor necrosis factor, alpha-induced protein 6 n=1 Tax=Stegastes partitus TaxID=144197 RepID=A0A3B5AU38_9TELE
MLLLTLLWTLSVLLTETHSWGFKNGIFHNSIWLEQAAGVYHRESRKGRYQLTYKEAKAVCKYEGGTLATYQQLEAARQIGFHVCAAGWFDKGRVGYPIVKAGANCGFGKVGIIDYGYRLNKSERWDVYCYNPNCESSFSFLVPSFLHFGFKTTCSFRRRVTLNVSTEDDPELQFSLWTLGGAAASDSGFELQVGVACIQDGEVTEYIYSHCVLQYIHWSHSAVKVALWI